MTIREIIDKAYDKYVCLQKEEFCIDYDDYKGIIVIRWHLFMDKFVNKTFLKRVSNVAKFIRKYDKEISIYDSFGNIY